MLRSSSSVRPQLDSLAATLRGWERAVPPRGRRFHELRAMLEGELRHLHARRVWVDTARLDSLKEGVERLQGIAGDLAVLCTRADVIAAEVRQLEARAAEVRDPDLAAWLLARCAGWATALAHLGADCQRRADLLAAQMLLDRVEEELRSLGETMRWCLRAAAALAAAGTDIAAAALGAALAELTQELLAGGTARDGLVRIKELVPPLEERAREVKDPPPELQTLDAVLADLWGWSRQLDAEDALLTGLEERRNFFAAAWQTRPPEELQALLAEVEALRQQLLARARERRQSRLHELETEVSDLFAACGPQPGMEAPLKALQEKPADRPRLFRDWIAAADQAAELFRAIATTQQGALEERLAGWRANLGGRLEELRSQPLADAVRAQADVLEHQVRKLDEATGVEEVLRALRRGGELERQLMALGLRAQRERARLSRQRERLSQRHHALRTAAVEVGIDLPDLAPRLAALGPGEHACTLEAGRRLATALLAELGTLERQLEARCRQLLAEALAAAAAAAAALERSGAGRAPAAHPELPAGADPRTAVAALLAGRRLAAELAERVAERLRQAAADRTCLAAELAALQPETLDPGERETAARLARELAEDAAAPAADPAARLGPLVEAVARCQLFLAQRQAGEHRARQGMAELRRRLAGFEQEQLRQHCPELADRVTGLAYGIGDQPRHWHDVQAQVDLGLQLLERLEAHARRLAAEEVQQAAAGLRDRLRRSLDPPRSAAVGALLAELDAGGHDALPPVGLRLRLSEALLRS